MRKVKFHECVAHEFLEARKGLRQDVPTRWNSTFLMLESGIYYRRALIRLQLSDSNYAKYCPSQEEWDKAEKIKKFLGVFYNATCVFSGTRYPTANLFFPQVFLVQHTIKMGTEDSDRYVKFMAMEMGKKFAKYWNDYNLLLAIACILDPCYKIQFVEFCYKRLYGQDSMQFENVKYKLNALFNEYASKSNDGRSKPLEELSKRNISHEYEALYDQDCMNVLKEFDSFESEVFSTSQKSQLDLYLDEPRMERNVELDILSFWKVNQFRYPELALLARDLLAVPISTVASESSFSIGGRILNEDRSALKPENVEAIICTHDWLYSNEDDLGDDYDVDDLAEDVMKMKLEHASSTQDSNTILLDN